MLSENELYYQKRVFQIISEPSKVFKTKSGKRLQFLSPGRISSSGPDFKDIALLINGYLIVGDAEFHIKSSNWIEHQHEVDENYKNVILHIVINDDEEIKGNFETFVIDKSLINFDNKPEDLEFKPISDIEEIQNFALLRLLRKTSDAQKLLNKNSMFDTLQIFVQEFISKYENRKHRPKYKSEKLSELIDAMNKSQIIDFLNDISTNRNISIPDIMQNLIKKKILDEGPHLRREIILNAVIPLALALANEENRINIFVWYWSTPALNNYGILNKKFPDNPQNFLWQQQGMLEYLRDYGMKANLVAESFREYGFLEVLHFYKNGRLPLEFFED